MKPLIPLLLILLFSQCYADPFYTEESTDQPTQQLQAVDLAQKIAKNPVKQTACTLPDELNIIEQIADFEQLKLVGLSQIDQKSYALFIDDKQQFIVLQPNDLIKHSLIQIKYIDLKALHYIDWSIVKTCENPTISLLKL